MYIVKNNNYRHFRCVNVSNRVSYRPIARALFDTVVVQYFMKYSIIATQVK